MMKDIPIQEIFIWINVKTSKFGFKIGGFPNLDVYDERHSKSGDLYMDICENIQIWYQNRMISKSGCV